MSYFNINSRQDLSVNRTLFNNEIKYIKTGASIICTKKPCFNFFSAMEKSYYVSILLKTSKGTAKTIHKETIKHNNGSITM